jgi:hypothetical protein
MKVTVAALVNLLRGLPRDAEVTAYEGEGGSWIHVGGEQYDYRGLAINTNPDGRVLPEDLPTIGDPCPDCGKIIDDLSADHSGKIKVHFQEKAEHELEARGGGWNDRRAEAADLLNGTEPPKPEPKPLTEDQLDQWDAEEPPQFQRFHVPRKQVDGLMREMTKAYRLYGIVRCLVAEVRRLREDHARVLEYMRTKGVLLERDAHDLKVFGRSDE